MNRRDLLLGGMAVAGAVVAGRVQAAEMTHDHSMHGQHHAAAAGYAALAAATADCIQKGEVCLNHCLMLLGQGDQAMAACARSVNQMLSVCRALQQLVNQESSHAARLASIALDVCKQCEDECRKHADKHEPCRACGEACAACSKECGKIAV